MAVLEGRYEAIRSERRRKLDAARRLRKGPTDLTREEDPSILEATGETETGSAGAQPDQGIPGRNFKAKSGTEGGLTQAPTAPSDFAEMFARA